MVSKPILQQPNFNKTFYLQMDTSKYGVGVVLSQEGEAKQSTPRKRHPIAFFSASFSPMEQNYDAHDLEFLGVLKSIYGKSPRKLMGRTAHWHEKFQDYNFKILHIPRKNNTPADALSRPSDEEQEVGEWQLTLLLQEAFLNLAEASSPDSLEALIVDAQ